jgi:pyruvate dehydrogenase E2 component (dihydrolipoamide acetyltransferase)
MPALSSTMTEGKIVSWLKGVGDKVEAGDAIMVVESDKADMDVESFEDGWIAAILTEEGESAAVGAPVAILVATEADIANVGSPGAAPAANGAAAPAAAAAAPPTAAAGGAASAKAIKVDMPALSSTMTEGRIVSWLKGVGDKVEAGDAIMVVESDKADMDVEAYEDGYIAAILCEEGESAAVGACVALLAPTEADIDEVAAGGAGGSSASAPAAAAPAAAPQAAPAASAAIINSGRVVASGFAKQVAAASGVDLRNVAGSGPGGRIVSADVTASAAAPGGAARAHVPAAGVVAATPTARALAKKNKVDLAAVAGTGNYGRVTEDDVLSFLGKPSKKAAAAPVAAAAAAPVAAAAAAAPAAKGATPAAAPAAKSGVVKMDGMMKAVAKNMEATMAQPVFRVSRAIGTDKFDELYAVRPPTHSRGPRECSRCRAHVRVLQRRRVRIGRVS